MVVSLALGALVAAVYMFRNAYTQSMAITLALLPVLVQSIILLVDVYKRQSTFPAIVLVVIVTTLVTPILLKMVMTRDPVPPQGAKA